MHAQAPDLLPVAQAYTAAWNAHDLAAVLACFAPEAIVRERRGGVPLHVWDSRDPQVVHEYLRTTNDGHEDDINVFTWATGQQQIASWAATRFAQRHRMAAGEYRAAGDTVSWPYQQFSDPYQSTSGVGPLEGTAEAVVRGGRITLLTLVLSPGSVARQRSEADAAIDRATASYRARLAPLIGGGSSSRPNGHGRDGPAAAEPPDAAWPLALGGLAGLGVVTAALTPPPGARPRLYQRGGESPSLLYVT